MVATGGVGFVSVVSRPRHSPYPMLSVQEAQDVILKHAVKNNPAKVQTAGKNENSGYDWKGEINIPGVKIAAKSKFYLCPPPPPPSPYLAQTAPSPPPPTLLKLPLPPPPPPLLKLPLPPLPLPCSNCPSPPLPLPCSNCAGHTVANYTLHLKGKVAQ